MTALPRKEIWVGIQARTGEYALNIVEREAMKQDVTMDAAGMVRGHAGRSARRALIGRSELAPASWRQRGLSLLSGLAGLSPYPFEIGNP